MECEILTAKRKILTDQKQNKTNIHHTLILPYNMTTNPPQSEWSCNGIKTRDAVQEIMDRCKKVSMCLVLDGPMHVPFNGTKLLAARVIWYHRQDYTPESIVHICGVVRCCEISHMVDRRHDLADNKECDITRKVCHDHGTWNCPHDPRCIATPKMKRAPKQRKRKVEDVKDVEPCEADDLDQPVASRKGRRTVGKFSKYE